LDIATLEEKIDLQAIIRKPGGEGGACNILLVLTLFVIYWVLCCL